MKRNFPNRSLLDNKRKSSEHVSGSQGNFCPLAVSRNESIGQNEVDRLITNYKKLALELKRLRGKLYTMGIDPEKYI